MNKSIPHMLLATGNAHKFDEMRSLLRRRLVGLEYELLSGADFPEVPEPVENGGSFEANALIKATDYARATGLLTLADDSGLVVDALDGRPGIQSARYAPTNDDRIQRVLNELEGVEQEKRTARFICVMALVTPDGRSITREGKVEGRITRNRRGDGGFGYDPIFELTETEFAGKTMAELSATQKNGLSHRGRALELIASPIHAALIINSI
mgnify:CR=1 FL=1